MGSGLTAYFGAGGISAMISGHSFSSPPAARPGKCEPERRGPVPADDKGASRWPDRHDYLGTVHGDAEGMCDGPRRGEGCS
jgi:hypothetical protein